MKPLLPVCVCWLLVAGPLAAQRLVYERLHPALGEQTNETVFRPPGGQLLTTTIRRTPTGPDSYAIVYALLASATGDTLWTRPGPAVPSGTASLTVLPGGGFAYAYLVRNGVFPNFTPNNGTDTGLETRDAAGRVCWTRRFDFFGQGEGTPTVLLPAPGGSGDLLLANDYASAHPWRNYFSLSRHDSLGTRRWLRSYGWDINDAVVSGTLRPDGKLVLVGNTSAGGVFGVKALLVDPATGDSLLGHPVRPDRIQRRAAAQCPYSGHHRPAHRHHGPVRQGQ